MAKDLYMHDFVHYSYANFINSLPMFIDYKIFDFEKWTISTYHKAIKREDQNYNYKMFPLPYMVCDPSLNLEIDDTSKQHWRFPIFGSGHVISLFEPIIKTSDILITPLFTTVNLTFDLICYFESVYQKLDFETALLLRFGGVDRWTIPYAITYDVPFPNALQDDTYIDLSEYGIPKAMFKSVGKELYVLPIYSKIMMRLNSISDNSEKYGNDDIANWRSIVNLTMKIPLFIGLQIQTNWQLRDLYININVDDPNLTVTELIGHGEPTSNDDNTLTTILIPDMYKLLHGEKHLVFEADNDYTEYEEFAIDLSDYDFSYVKTIFLDNDYRIDGKIIYVTGPLYKGQHIHIILGGL